MITNPYHTIQTYAEAHTTAETPLLASIRAATEANVAMPQMLSSPLQGRILATFSQMLQPKRILEIGTYTGYSAICLTEGLAAEGLLYTIDKNETLAASVRDVFSKAGITEKVHYLLGKALDIIPSLDETFDLVFIDADKKNYSQYYELVLPKVRSGGFIIADNVLWRGKVLPTTDKVDAKTQSMQAFNQQVQQDSRVTQVLFPVRDGLMVIRKQ